MEVQREGRNNGGRVGQVWNGRSWQLWLGCNGVKPEGHLLKPGWVLRRATHYDVIKSRALKAEGLYRLGREEYAQEDVCRQHR